MASSVVYTHAPGGSQASLYPQDPPEYSREEKAAALEIVPQLKSASELFKSLDKITQNSLVSPEQIVWQATPNETSLQTFSLALKMQENKSLEAETKIEFGNSCDYLLKNDIFRMERDDKGELISVSINKMVLYSRYKFDRIDELSPPPSFNYGSELDNLKKSGKTIIEFCDGIRKNIEKSCSSDDGDTAPHNDGGYYNSVMELTDEK